LRTRIVLFSYLYGLHQYLVAAGRLRQHVSVCLTGKKFLGYQKLELEVVIFAILSHVMAKAVLKKSEKRDEPVSEHLSFYSVRHRKSTILTLLCLMRYAACVTRASFAPSSCDGVRFTTFPSPTPSPPWAPSSAADSTGSSNSGSGKPHTSTSNNWSSSFFSKKRRPLSPIFYGCELFRAIRNVGSHKSLFEPALEKDVGILILIVHLL
jgi:hypothetical protein